MRLALINPNTSHRITQQMVAIAAEAAGSVCDIIGLTAQTGASLIVDEPKLRQAASAVLALAPSIVDANCDGAIVSAFGDPGLNGLRSQLDMPVTGIAEAAMAEASAGGRQFIVVTTTPLLVKSIEATAQAYGHGRNFLGVAVTRQDPLELMDSAENLKAALKDACERAVQQMKVDAIIIGGGPLAMAARVLSGEIHVPLFEPIPAAVRPAIRRLNPMPEMS